MNLFDDVQESKPQKKSDEELHFFYDRDERIARAPKIVQDYYNGNFRQAKGLKIFFTSQNRYIFFALVIFVGAAWFYSGLNRTRNRGSVNGIDCKVQAFSYGEEIFTTLQFNVKEKPEILSPKKISGQVLLIDSNGQVSNKDDFDLIIESGEEFVRSKHTDYDIIRIDVEVNVDGEKKEFSTAVKR